MLVLCLHGTRQDEVGVKADGCHVWRRSSSSLGEEEGTEVLKARKNTSVLGEREREFD